MWAYPFFEEKWVKEEEKYEQTISNSNRGYIRDIFGWDSLWAGCGSFGLLDLFDRKIDL
jgi:hypothetical protein